MEFDGFIWNDSLQCVTLRVTDGRIVLNIDIDHEFSKQSYAEDFDNIVNQVRYIYSLDMCVGDIENVVNAMLHWANSKHGRKVQIRPEKAYYIASEDPGKYCVDGAQCTDIVEIARLSWEYEVDFDIFADEWREATQEELLKYGFYDSGASKITYPYGTKLFTDNKINGYFFDKEEVAKYYGENESEGTV